MITITVHSAEFNHPEHPATFTPEDIGIVRNQTAIERRDEADRVIAYGFYDGEGFVTPERLAASGKRPARTSAPSAHPPAPGELSSPTTVTRITYETVWEAYTGRFIDKYKLDQEQTQKACRICHDCEERARAYLNKSKDRFEGLEKRLEELDREPSEPDRDRRIRQIRGELALLMRPVQTVFERQLKPRLDKLPTRAQRQAAEQREPEAPKKNADTKPEKP
jgi:hypothetical protein